MWFTEHHCFVLSRLYKKRLRGVIGEGHNTYPHAMAKNVSGIPRDKFSESDWLKWLDHVRQFYVTSSTRIARSRGNETEASPLFIKQSFDNRPYILVKLFDKNITVLFDTGATSSIVGADGVKLLSSLNLKINKSPDRYIRTADETRKLIKGVVDLPISVGNICHIVKALVVPSLPRAFIFGSDFARLFNLSLDFKNESWSAQVTNTGVDVSIVKEPIGEPNVGPLLLTLDDLTEIQRGKADRVIKSFEEIDSMHRIGRTDKITMSIDTGDAKPFKKRPYLMSPYMLKILNEELDRMLELGVVEPSNSAWSSPVLLVKKSGGEYRFCFDGRALNEVTKHDSYPLPHIDRILSMLRGAKYVSSIDLRKAFWQIPLDPASREKTAFSIVGRGLFHFVTMPFGLCNAAQTQQRLVDAIFGPRYEPNIFTYLDDIIICSSTFDEHIKLLSEVKERLREANLTINLNKCEFFKTSLKFLGFIVGSNSLRTDPEKVSSMLNYPRPTSTTEIKRFVGLCSWYRRFIKDFSTLLSPLNDLLKGKKKNQKVVWTPEAEASFVKIKELLISAPILSQPDFSKPFTIQCDASDTGLGGVLTQVLDNEEEKVIAYASRTLSRTERNYSATEKELLSVLFCISKFRPYVEGTRFTVVTDHYSLLWLNNMKNPTGKLARWAVKLREHSFDLVHRKGKFNVVPDALSRSIPKDPETFYLEVDIERIDPWYDKLRRRIIARPDDFPQFKVEDDFVYKFIPSNLPLTSNIKEWKTLVPKPQRSEIIRSCHDPPTSGHFGFYKTLFRLQEHYYWPKMRHDVLKFVRSCIVCGAQKTSNTSRMGLMGKEKIVNIPFQIIALDLMGPFPRSKKGHKWLLVIGDWFSKYTLLFPLRNATARSIEMILEDKVFLVYGVPQIVICDNGSQLSGKIFKNVCQKYQVQIWYNAVYSAQCNFVERNNQTVGTTIRCYIDEHPNWDIELAKVQQAINTARHEVTGFTPCFLNFGRHIPLSGKYYGEISTNDVEILPGDRSAYAADMQGLTEIFSAVRNKLHSAYEKNKRAYNLRKRDSQFNVGDKVWRRNKILSSAPNRFASKLAPKYILSKVTKKLSRLVYRLSNLDGSKAGNWHIKDLKPYRGTASDSEQETPSVDSD